MSDSGTVKSVKKAFDALSFIMEASLGGEATGLGDVASAVGIQPTTARNILKTMESSGFVSRDDRRNYCPGPKCVSLLRGALGGQLIKAAGVPLSALAHRTGESVVLASMLNGRRQVLMRAEGNQIIKVSHDIMSKNAYTTVTARVMLAFADEAEVDLFIEENGLPGDSWAEADNKEKMFPLFEEIRRVGYAEDVRDLQVAQLAFPILRDDLLVGSVGMYLPDFRYTPEKREELIREMRKTVDEITHKIQNK